MRYIAAALSDVGKRNNGNQDSLCVKIATLNGKSHVVMAIICDGMGGLAKGELASASMIQAFSRWFDEGLPAMEQPLDLKQIEVFWRNLIEQTHKKLKAYGEIHNVRLGTTFSGLFIFDNKYLIMQLGDTRIYEVADNCLALLTEDQTVAMREFKNGNLSFEELQKDPRRSILIQSIGVSKQLNPAISYGIVNQGSVFLLCTDGLHHTLEAQSLLDKVSPSNLTSIRDLCLCCETLITGAIEKRETDNISVALVKCY